MPLVVLFDLDGTLVDTMPRFATLAASVLQRHHGVARGRGREMYLRTSGVPFAAQLHALFGAHPANEAASAEFERRKHPVARAARMDVRTVRALEGLRSWGLSLVVSSNAAQSHVDHFAAAHPGLFALALGAGDRSGKGEAHVRRICVRFGVDREELVFVGDSLHDGDIAASTGMQFVARAGTFSREALRARFPSARVISHVDELASVLAGVAQPGKHVA